MQAAKLRAARYTYVPALDLMYCYCHFSFISLVAMTVMRFFSLAGHAHCENVILKNYFLLDDSYPLR
jgi:hypothetical protein